MATDTYMMTDEEVRVRRARRRRIQLSILSVIALLVIGIFAARPATHAIKAWQARRHAGKAFAFMAQEKWNDARNEVTAAYQLRQTEPQAVRAVARFLSRTRQPDALGFWQQLAKIDKLTTEDLRDEAAIALFAGEMATAESAVESLRKNKDAGAADWILAAQLSIQKGEINDAFGFVDKIMADPRSSEQQQLQAALLERSLAANSAGNEERLTEAWQRLEKLASQKSAAGLDALVVLAQQLIAQPRDTPHPFGLTTEEIRQRIESHPLAKAPHKLLALDLLEHVDLARREANVDQAVAQWKDADASQLLALATWLNGKGEYQREIEAIPLEKALQTRELFLQRTDALGALDRWSEVKQLLDSDQYPLDQVVQRMYLARCNAQLGEKAAAENNWQRALELSGGDVGKLMLLADYAEKNGNRAIAEAAYSAATTASPKLRPALQGRLRIAQGNGDTKKMHDVLAEMLRLWPNDPAVQNDKAYTRLLLLFGKDEGGGMKDENGNEALSTSQHLNPSTADELKKISEVAERLVQRNPRSLPHRTLLALALLEQNRAADALKLYENLQISTNALTPSALAVHAAVLAANGKNEDAEAETKQIKIDNLLPEERELIRGVTSDK